MSAYDRWVGTFGGSIAAKQSLMGAQAQNQLAEAGLRSTQAGVLPGQAAAENTLKYAQSEYNVANAGKTAAETKEVAANALSARGLNSAQANNFNATAGATNLDSSFRRPMLPAAQRLGAELSSRPTDNLIGALGGGGDTGVKPFDIWRRDRGYAKGGMVMPYDESMVTPGYANGGMADGMRTGGYMKGGMVMNCNDGGMIPGYEHGGQAHGLRAHPGPIGNVAHDRGVDTMDAKVRPGEYMLNPETVAYMGGGDYTQGVRQLNQLVREATGKEPGPTPVGKSGEPGYAFGGETLSGWFDAGKNLASNAAQRLSQGWEGIRTAPGQAAAAAPAAPAAAAAPTAAPSAASFGPRVAPEQTIYVDSEGGATRGHPSQSNPNIRGGGMSAEAEQFLKQRAAQAAQAEQAAAQGARGTAYNAGRALAENARAAGAATRDAATRTFGGMGNAAGAVIGGGLAAAEGLSNVTNNQGFYDDPNVPTVEKAKQWARDASKPVASVVGGTIGAGMGTVASPTLVVNPVTGGAAGAIGLRSAVGAVIDEKGDALKKWEAANPKAVKAPEAAGAQAAQAGKPAMTEEQMRKEYDEYAKSQGLRNTQALYDAFAKVAAMGSKEGPSRYVSDLMQVGRAGSTAAEANAKAIDEHLSKRYQIPVTDKDGKITGYKENPDAANAARDALASKGINIYSAPRAVVDNELRSLDRVYSAQQGFNNVAREERGEKAVISNDVRGLRVKRGISLGNALFDDNNAVSLGDWARAKWAGNNDVNNMLVTDPLTGQTAAAGRVFRNPDGSLNLDTYKEVLRAQAEADAKKK